ncbi:GGDEF domain-containing protein [Paracidovorax konjaci]|uniref:diguanylate cyclase n=1 Tax=Paracidovorax konjaci TaxID=32040 RepID=A0A1I1VEZ5_9BURK|nr:GGDEF domain-containing protein [Paracidovorax konjaci]SFD81439.1 diguanylate cyclase (GGDEF) domain-containing protein [Paracidovorax konjaci]
MALDFVTLLAVTATNLLMLSLALPLIMGRGVSRAARCAQASIGLQALSWAAIIASSHAWDRALSTLSIACTAAAQWALFAALSEWLGPRPGRRWLPWLAAAIPLGYTLGFGHYAFRVGWSNLLLAVLIATVARATLAPLRPSPLRWRLLLCACLVTMAGFTAARGVLGAFTDAYPSFRTPHPVNIGAALAANVTLVLGMVALLVAWRTEAEEKLRALATTDALTALLNRRGFDSQGRAMLAHALRQRQPLTALMVDVDHFKQVNDAHGHAAGDRALVLFARLLRETARASDIVARMGGEEFGVLLSHEPGVDAAWHFDRRLRARLAAEGPETLGFTIGYSAGATTLDWHAPTPAATHLSDVMARADAALYEAKRRGRGCLCRLDAPDA